MCFVRCMVDRDRSLVCGFLFLISHFCFFLFHSDIPASINTALMIAVLFHSHTFMSYHTPLLFFFFFFFFFLFFGSICGVLT